MTFLHNRLFLQVFLMLFFFTSPPIILSQMDIILHLKSIGQSMSLPEKINDFAPTLMLWWNFQTNS